MCIRDRSEVRQLRKAAEVLKNLEGENCEHMFAVSVCEVLLDKHRYLTEIHTAPTESWPALCDYLLTAQDVTVTKISGKAKELVELKKAIPDWWSDRRGAGVGQAIWHGTQCVLCGLAPFRHSAAIPPSMFGGIEASRDRSGCGRIADFCAPKIFFVCPLPIYPSI